MSLIQTLNSLPIIEEDAASGAVGAGSVSSVAMPLFSSLVKRQVPTTQSPRIIKFTENTPPKKVKKLKLGISEAFHTIQEDLAPDRPDQNFDSSEIISKLKSLEDQESVDYKDSVTFGLVDTNGGIVKVTIPKDQASGFEQDIQHIMGEYEEDEPTPEIAEILFTLKNHYTIVNVEWPEVEEDAEDSASTLQPDQQGAEGQMGADGMPGDDQGMGEELPGMDDPNTMGGGEDTASVTSLLTQVIDMMKADADARKSEAQAREAEAKTRQAGAARDQAMARVKQEEQMLDMEEFNKGKKEREKEAKRLAQLAKWKHDVSSGQDEERPAQEPNYDFLPGDENEEYAKLDFRKSHRSAIEDEEKVYKQPSMHPRPSGIEKQAGKVAPSDIAKFIMSRVK